VPSDGAALYGARVGFIARGLGLGEISPRGYEAVIDRVVELAVELDRAGASAVSLMGTSLSFFAAPTSTLRSKPRWRAPPDCHARP
jgi:arylmalonate decarboxylase